MKLLWVVVVTQWVVAPVKDMNQKLIVFIVNAIYILNYSFALVSEMLMDF